MIETKIIIKNYINQLYKIKEKIKEDLPIDLSEKKGQVIGPPAVYYPILDGLTDLIDSMVTDIEEYGTPSS